MRTKQWVHHNANRLPDKQNSSFYYQLAIAGDRTNLADSVAGASRVYFWQHESLYRLTNEAVNGTGPVGALAYTYDLVGNLLSRMGSLLAKQTFTYDGNDRMSGDFYDKDGNTTNHNSLVWTYDFEDRLLGNGSVSLSHNADGRVTKRVYNGTNTMYFVDALNPPGYPQILEEFTVSGTTNLAAAYTYGLSRISMRQPNVTTNFYGFDGHGSTRFLLSTVGTVTESYLYDAYGVLISGGTVVSNNFWHCGEYHDAGLGLYDMRARHLNAGTGRFFTLDTFPGLKDDPSSLHKYSYCANNPVNRVDPTGMIDLEELQKDLAEGGEKALHGITDALKTIADGASGAAGLSQGLVNAGPGLIAKILHDQAETSAVIAGRRLQLATLYPKARSGALSPRGAIARMAQDRDQLIVDFGLDQMDVKKGVAPLELVFDVDGNKEWLPFFIWWRDLNNGSASVTLFYPRWDSVLKKLIPDDSKPVPIDNPPIRVLGLFQKSTGFSFSITVDSPF